MVTLRNGAPGQSPSCPAIRSIVRFQDQTESSAPLPAAPRGRTIPRANADPLQATPTYTRRLSSLVKCPLSHVGRMLASPFTFYRGAAAIMAADLAPSSVSGITVQLCGDAHLSNFGVFGTPERQLIFDINDFDETLPGPWEWDVKRMAASFEVMGRFRGFPPTTGMRSSPPGCASTGSGCAGPPGAAQYARFCGATLARAHARWGDRIAIASYLGQGDLFDRAIASFSAAYADQNERDYQAFTEAVNSGRLTAQTGV